MFNFHMLNARLKTYTAFTDKDVTYTAIGAVRTVYKKIRPDQTDRPEVNSLSENSLFDCLHYAKLGILKYFWNRILPDLHKLPSR